MRKAVFFDLDGTLLPLDMELFISLYYEAIEDNGVMRLIHPENGHEIFEKAIHAMMANDGRATNADVFCGVIERLSGMDRHRFTEIMDAFYHSGYKRIRAGAQREARVSEAVETLKGKEYRLIISTNPLFPAVATNQRVEWAGLDPSDFEYVSYYDNSSFCKPNPGYYREILAKTGLDARECYIVGNDVREDMSAVALGFKGFLLTDHLIGDLERAPECQKGDYSALLAFAKSLPPT
jgi:FMN phosphatase YigB (HAD superfamily)